MKIKEIPIWQKLNLTIEEAAAYSNIGIGTIRELIKDPNCDFLLKIGVKKSLIKRLQFEKFIMNHSII